MIHLFYLFGITYILRQIMQLVNPSGHTIYAASVEKVMAELKKRHEEAEKNPTAPRPKDIPEGVGYMMLLGVYTILSLVWVVVGLLTFNWMVFAVYLVFNLLITSSILTLIKKTFGLSKMYTFAIALRALINIGIIGFAIVNHYHLRIDLLSLFTS